MIYFFLIFFSIFGLKIYFWSNKIDVGEFKYRPCPNQLYLLKVLICKNGVRLISRVWYTLAKYTR